jgi:hypothetical protein
VFEAWVFLNEVGEEENPGMRDPRAVDLIVLISQLNMYPTMKENERKNKVGFFISMYFWLSPFIFLLFSSFYTIKRMLNMKYV